MSEPVQHRPRLAEVGRPAAAAVVVGSREPPNAGPVLRLLPPRGGNEQLHATAVRTADEVVLGLELPGIGMRYLRRVATSATASGWSAAETAGLLVELQVRCVYWIAAPRARELVNGGRSVRSRSFRLSAVEWSAAGWRTADAGPQALHDIVREALERDAVAIVTASGQVPRGLDRKLEALAAAGFDVRFRKDGSDPRPAGRWAVEALAVPRLDGSLAHLREQFAAAPRCGWCAIPVIGRRCRRCAPAVTG